MNISKASEAPILFYDGVCNLCNWGVDFVLKHEKDQAILFASIQSHSAQTYLRNTWGITHMESVIFIKSGKVYDSSDVIMQVANHLKMPYRFLNYFKVVPTFIRDGLYQWVAKKRYSLFGKKSDCRLPTAQEKYRFIH